MVDHLCGNEVDLGGNLVAKHGEDSGMRVCQMAYEDRKEEKMDWVMMVLQLMVLVLRLLV